MFSGRDPALMWDTSSRTELTICGNKSILGCWAVKRKLEPEWEARIRRVHDDLRGMFFGRDPDFMWDTSSRTELMWPGLRVGAVERFYFYIGREAAKPLYDTILQLPGGNIMQVLGAKGSGKSIVMAAIAGYLHGSSTKPIVYLSGFQFIDDPFTVAQEALLLCYAGNDQIFTELLEFDEGLDELMRWCVYKELCFIVDDWDKVEQVERCRTALTRAANGNVLIRISSINSREREAYETSDKAGYYIRSEDFDGPFLQAELQTWIAHSGLTAERLEGLDYFTGGMPRLLAYYSMVYERRISWPVVNRLETELVAKLGKKENVSAALQLVTSHEGTLIPPQLEGMKLSCFYRKNYLYRITSPYLRTVAEKLIIDHGLALDRMLQLADVQVWIAAVRADLRVPQAARNPARIGWNVEGLVIGAIRVQKQLASERPILVYKTYAHGKELEALDLVTDDELKGGVLIGPEAFNEKAVDIIYLIEKAGLIYLIAVQITVAKWKAREGKKSHVTWKDSVLPTWKAGLPQGMNVETTFLYVMPEDVKLEDVSEVEFKRFGQICPLLHFLDSLLLESPKAAIKQAKMKCKGLNRDKVMKCGNTHLCSKCTAGEFCDCEWYCHFHLPIPTGT